MKKILYVLVSAILIGAGSSMALAAGKAAKPDVHLFTRYESHSQQGNSDFWYRGLFVTQELQKNYVGTISFLNKYNVSETRNDTNIAGVSVTNMRSKRPSLIYSYSNVSNPEHQYAGITSSDADKWLLLAQYGLRERKSRKLSLNLSYSTSTDFSDGRTINTKLKYGFNFSKKLAASVSAQDSYSANLSDSVLQIYEFDLSYPLKKKTKLHLNYLFLDMNIAGLDDDNILQTGIFQTLN